MRVERHGTVYRSHHRKPPGCSLWIPTTPMPTVCLALISPVGARALNLAEGKCFLRDLQERRGSFRISSRKLPMVRKLSWPTWRYRRARHRRRQRTVAAIHRLHRCHYTSPQGEYLFFAPPVALNFWRAEPRGFLCLFRALEDDMSRAPIRPEPMKTLEFVVGTLRVTESILVAIAIAKSLPMRRPPKLLMLTHAIQVTRSPQPFSPF
jgi:hypothetical protein